MKITGLLAQLPLTDIEAEIEKALKQPPVPEKAEPAPPGGKAKPAKKKPAVKILPPDVAAKEPSKFTGPKPELAASLCEQVLAGGQAALSELTGLVRPVADPAYQGYKAEYLFHCLTVHVGQPGKERPKKRLVEFLAAQVGNEKLARPARAFLVRELQWLAGHESVHALGQLLTDDDLCEPAAAALVHIGAGAVNQLIASLPRAKGACRLIVVQSLGSLGATAPLRELLQDSDAAVRSAAAWGLARAGDVASVDVLLKVAPPPACLLLAETLLAKDRQREAAKIYQHLRDTRAEKHLQQLATKALAGLRG